MKRLTNEECDTRLKDAGKGVLRDGDVMRGCEHTKLKCGKCEYKWGASIGSYYKKNKPYGCPSCGDNLPLTPESLIIKANFIDRKIELLCDSIVNNHTKVPLRCGVCHHEWSAQPANLIQGKGCPQCANGAPVTIKSLTKNAHLNKRKIELLCNSIVNSSTKIPVRCGECSHIWEVTPSSLIQNHGCPKCNVPRGGVGFYQTSYKNDPLCKTLSTPGMVYIVHLSKNNQNFIKIGITKRTTTKRLGATYHGYKVKILHEIKLPTLRECCELENKLLAPQEEHKYTPSTKFYGHTECMTYDALEQIEANLREYRPEEFIS